MPTSALPPELWSIFNSATNLFDARQQLTYSMAQGVMSQITSSLSQVISAASSIASITANTVPFDATGAEALDLNLPDPPGAAPNAAMNIVASLPSDPGNVNISISDIDQPTMDASAPSAVINPGSAEYSSTLLEAVRDRIINDLLTGSTGIDPNVEVQIWDRNLQRDLQELRDAKSRIAADIAKRGWPLPDGVLITALDDLEIKHSDKRYDASRDISIKQAEMTYQGVKDRLTIGVELEKGLMSIFSDIQGRLFKASAAQIEGEINIFRAQVDQTKAMTDMYTALVGARIEEAKAIVTIYSAKVQAYTAAVQAEAARVEATIKAFVGTCEAYKAQVSALASMNEVQVKLFECKIRQAVAEADVAIKNAQIAVENQRFKESLEVQIAEVLLGTLTQLEAGLMSSISLSAHIDASNSASYQYHAPATIDEVYEADTL